PVSAFHGTGVSDLVDVVRKMLPPPTPEEQQFDAVSDALPIAIVGRPNVGKSALLNAILGEERVIVSPIPGTTRDAIDTEFRYGDQDMVLIDTAGMRRRGRISAGVEYYSVLRAVKAMQRADVAVLVLDAFEGVTAQDVHVAGYVQDENKGIVVVVNKWDLVSPKDPTAWTAMVRHALKFFPHAPVVFTSALQGRGVDKVLKAAVKIHEERSKKIPTTALNLAVKDALATHAPPSYRGKTFKIYYASQVASNPPTFVFFVNNRELMHFSYQRFLENKLRAAFGFEGTTIRMIFRDHEDQDRHEERQERGAH
ncbi:MAG: ribosome biogenesis GTPase Der, partial [Chloroflexi bacterium]|nr:ribosome biogenesis GTPase Der [Chloroflexota bacterium]